MVSWKLNLKNKLNTKIEIMFKEIFIELMELVVLNKDFKISLDNKIKTFKRTN